MLRIDGRVLVAAVAGLFLVGMALGFFVGGGLSAGAPATAGQATDGPPTAQPQDGTGSASTATPAPVTTTGTSTGTTTVPGTTLTPTPTATATQVPTPTATATATPAQSTRTPMLIRRFSAAKIRSELLGIINDWRDDRGLPPLENEGTLAAELRQIATNHSIEMADAGKTLHVIDNRTSAERYRDHDIYWPCSFTRNNQNYLVTPSNNDLEVISRTWAGKSYVEDGVRRYNENETEVARAIFQDLLSRWPYRQRLRYRNADLVGIGIELTRKNEVYATANLCGADASD